MGLLLLLLDIGAIREPPANISYGKYLLISSFTNLKQINRYAIKEVGR